MPVNNVGVSEYYSLYKIILGKVLEIPLYMQNLISGDMIVEGELIIDGEQIII